MKVKTEERSSEVLNDLFDIFPSPKENFIFNKVVLNPNKVSYGDLFITKEREGAAYNFVDGGAYVLVSTIDPVSDENEKKGIFYTHHKNPVKKLFSYFRERNSATYIAVTGSVGKSTVKEMISHVLSGFGVLVKNGVNGNRLPGVLEALNNINQNTDFAVMELGTLNPGSIREMADLVIPDIVIITSIESSHQQNFSSLQALKEEKTSIIDGLRDGGYIVTTRTVLERCSNIFEKASEKKATIVVVGEEDGFCFSELSKDVNGLSFNVSCKGDWIPVKMKSWAAHDAENALFVLAVSWIIGVDLKKVSELLGAFNGVPKRLERYEVENVDGDVFTFIDDSHNSSPKSVKGAVESLCGIGEFKRKIFILGDMLELSNDPDEVVRIHLDALEYVNESGFSEVALIGGNFIEALRVSDKDKSSFSILSGYDYAVEFIVKNSRCDDVVLVKGSHGIGLYKVISSLKMHPSIKNVRKII